MNEQRIVEALNNMKPAELPAGFDQNLHLKLAETAQENVKPASVFSKFTTSFNSNYVLVYAFSTAMFLLIGLAGIQKMMNTTTTQYAGEKSAVILSADKGAGSLTTCAATDSVGLNQESYLRLNFKSGKDIKGISFEVTLPEGVIAVGQEGNSRKVGWNTSLVKGENFALIKVKGAKSGDWQLEVRIKKDGLEKQMKRSVKVTGV
ncbi:MAG: hypothetical protein WC955_12960 [Elusimicrobiota bacterium]